jgi:hypothetical protein
MKRLVNKVRLYGSKKWTNRLVVKRLVRAYTIWDATLVSIIRGYTIYRMLTLDDVLARIINHEILLEEAKYVKNLSKGIVSTKKDDIALKTSKKGKKKQAMVDSSSEEQEEEYEDETKEYDEEEITLFIKKFNKYMSKRRPFKEDKKERTTSKRVCYNCEKSRHFIAQCPYERREEDVDKKKKKERNYKTRSSSRRSPMEKLTLDKSGSQVMRASNRKVMTRQP